MLARFSFGLKGSWLPSFLLSGTQIGWLTFLSTAIPPIGGVIIADYVINKKRYQFLANGSRRKVNWVAIVAVAIGIICANFLPGIVPINSVLGSAISYIIINPIERKVRLSRGRK